MTRNYAYAILCEHCYLTHCVFESSRLGMYCPEYQARKHKIDPAVMLAIVKATGVNRKWLFLEGIQKLSIQGKTGIMSPTPISESKPTK